MPETKTCVELPVFDISQPLSPSSLSSFSEACREWGFFSIANHGVPKDLYRKLYSLSNDLFSLPTESKLKLGPTSSLKTYTPHFIASPFFESLRVSARFLCFCTEFNGCSFRPAKLRVKILKAYGSMVTKLSKEIVKLVLKSLGGDLEEKYNESQFSNCHGYLRIINYTPPKSRMKEGVEGLGMHTDVICVTIIYQDEIGGLQVRSKEGKWMDINPCEETLVVNIGDLMHAWSNGKLRSSEHRVVLKRIVNRLSLAFFWCFEDEKVIFAPNEVVGEDNLRIYKPFVCADYLEFRQSSEKGKFEKVGFTVKDFAGIDTVSEKQ